MNCGQPQYGGYNRMATLWYTQWRSHIAMARLKPDEREGYCLAACIANAQYLIAQVVYSKKGETK